MKLFAHTSQSERGGPYVNDLLLGLNAHEMVSMVCEAAFRVIETCDSRSPYYVRPEANSVPTHHAEARARFMNRALGISPAQRVITEEDAYLWSSNDLNLLKSFARTMNTLDKGSVLLPLLSNWWVLRAVYVALVTSQRHQVAVIKATHAVHGKHFGSALQYQQIGDAADVMDWPFRENWNVEELPVPPLPKDEPGYLDEESSEEEPSSAKPHGGFSTSDTAQGPND